MRYGSRRIQEIADRVYQVPVRGACVFLLLDGEEVTLVDTGMPGSGSRIFRALGALGRTPQALRRILITHFHPDHIGGLGELLGEARAEVAIHRLEAPAVRGEARFPSPFAWRFLGWALGPVVRRLMRGACTPRVREMEDDELLPISGGLRVVLTPGHTQGHAAFYLEKKQLLIGGDSLQRWGSRLVGPHFLYTSDPVAASKSARRLALLEVETLALSHFHPLHGAQPALRELAERLDRR